jgi:hypothetical protein
MLSLAQARASKGPYLSLTQATRTSPQPSAFTHLHPSHHNSLVSSLMATARLRQMKEGGLGLRVGMKAHCKHGNKVSIGQDTHAVVTGRKSSMQSSSQLKSLFAVSSRGVSGHPGHRRMRLSHSTCVCLESLDGIRVFTCWVTLLREIVS